MVAKTFEWDGDYSVPQKLCKSALVEDYRDGHWDYDEKISRFSVASVPFEGTEGKIHVFHGPCHSALHRVQGNVLAMSTAPDVGAWGDPGEWGGGRRTLDIPDCLADDVPRKLEGWWDWLIHDSRWASVFVDSVPPNVARKEGILINVNLPSNFVMQGVIGTRHPHEFTDRPVIWYDAVEAGGDPNILAVLVENFEIKGRGGKPHLRFFAGGDIHDMFESRFFGREVTRNFIRDRRVQRNLTLFESSRYSGVHNLYGEINMERFSREPGPVLKGMRQWSDCIITKDDMVWGKEGPKKVKTKEKGLTYEGGVQMLAEFSQQLKEEFA